MNWKERSRWKRNTEDYYLNNKTDVSAKWNEHFGNIAATQPKSQFLQQSSFYISNNFDYLKSTDNKNFRVGSHIAYTSQHQSLGVSPILFEDIFKDLSDTDTFIRQDVSYNHLRTDHYISGGSLGKRFSFSYSTNVFSNHYLMQSDLFLSDAPTPILADSLQNKLRRHEIGARLNASFSYHFSENFIPIYYDNYKGVAMMLKHCFNNVETRL